MTVRPAMASTRRKCSTSEKGRFFSLPRKTPEVVARWCDDACFISRPEGGGIPFLVSATNCCLPFCVVMQHFGDTAI